MDKKNKILRKVLASFIVITVLSSCTKNDDIAAIDDNVALTDDVGSIKTAKLNDQTITYIKKNGKNFFQGDIVLTDDQVEDNSSKNNKVAASFSRWPQGRVYYTIANNMGGINKNKIINAVKEYNTKTNVQWIPRSNQNDYVEFIFGSSSGSDGWAHIGKRGGKQNVSLDQNISLGSVIHEMGHSIGLYHEHTRADRDQHVKILWHNIMNNQTSNFTKYSSGTDIGPFDIKSVMMYWPNSYSKNGLPTIVKANGDNFTYTRNGFTPGDISTINTAYP